MKPQVVLDGGGGVEDSATWGDHQHKAIYNL